MAQDIGLLLRGLGAAFSNTVPQFRQEMAQEQESQYLQQQRQQQVQMRNAEMLQARQAAMYKDAESALKLMAMGDLDGVVALGQERLQLLSNFPDADPSDTARLTQFAMQARAGDREAYNNLSRELLGTVQRGLAMGVLTPPEVNQPEIIPSSSIVDGQVVTRDAQGNIIATRPQGLVQAPAAVERPQPQSPIGRMQADISSGFIPEQLGRALIQAEIAGAQRTQTEAERAAQQAQTQQNLMNDEAVRALALAESLIADPNLPRAVGAIQAQYIPTLRAGTKDVEIKFNELKNLLTMGNLERMTGVLSESDIKLIASAASGLDLAMSDEAAAAKLAEIRDRLTLRLREKGLIPAESGQRRIISGQVQREQPAQAVVNWNDL